MPDLLPNTAPKMALFFGLLVAIDAIKHADATDPWAYFTRDRVTHYVVLFLLFLLFSAVAPDLAGIVLGGIVLLSALSGASALTEWLRRSTLGSLPNPSTRGK